VLRVLHETLISNKNDILNVNGGPLDESPKNRAFVSFMVDVDSSLKDSLRDIEKLYDKIYYKLSINQYFRKKREYKESIKKYIECHKKYFREYKTDEEQKRKLVRKARESLETLRECLLDMNFECFAETEEGSKIVLLEEKARKIYQGTIDEVQEKIDQEIKFYTDFLSNRNAFLLDWNMPEDDIEQEEYTNQEIHYINRMKENLQKYVDISMEEVKKFYEQSLDDEELLNNLIEFLTQKDYEDIYELSTSYDLKDIKNLIKDIKKLHQHIQEGLSNDHDFQEDYYEKYHKYTYLIDQVKKVASSKRTRDYDRYDMEAQDADTLERSYHAQEIYDKASEVLFQLMDIREALLERYFELFAETEQGKEIAQLEEQARQVYWGTTDHMRAKADQEHEYYADFLSHRNAFLREWNRSQGDARQEKYTAQEISYIDRMKENLHHYLQQYQQEVKRSYEKFLADDAFHERLIGSLSAEKRQEIRKLVQSHGLKDFKMLLEDVKDLHRSIYEEWHGGPDFQRYHAALQEEYYEKYNEYNNIIDQFNISITSENALKVIITMIDIRYFLLMKTSDAFFVKKEQGREIASMEKKFEAFLRNEEGKHINACLEEISVYLRYSKYLRHIVEKELNKFENKKREIFNNYDTFLVNTESFKKRQMRELHDQLFIAKIKIEERLYVLFLHHDAGQQTKQLEEKYRAFADTIDFLFNNTPLDLQNTLRAPAKEYNAAKADLVKQLAHPESSESSVKRCIEKINRSLADQITSMKEKIWSQFRIFWYESGAMDEIMDFLLAQSEYKQGELENYIENILNLSGKIADELYQNDGLREALKIQFVYNTQKHINGESEDNEDQPLRNAQSVYDHLMLLHHCMMTDCPQGS